MKADNKQPTNEVTPALVSFLKQRPKMSSFCTFKSDRLLESSSSCPVITCTSFMSNGSCRGKPLIGVPQHDQGMSKGTVKHNFRCECAHLVQVLLQLGFHLQNALPSLRLKKDRHFLSFHPYIHLETTGTRRIICSLAHGVAVSASCALVRTSSTLLLSWAQTAAR